MQIFAAFLVLTQRKKFLTGQDLRFDFWGKISQKSKKQNKQNTGTKISDYSNEYTKVRKMTRLASSIKILEEIFS